MSQLKTSPDTVGRQTQYELIGRPGAPLPFLRDTISGQSPEQQDLAYAQLAELWGHSEPETIPLNLAKLCTADPSAFAHKESWKLLLRVAQCAVLVEERPCFDLKPLDVTEANPRKAASLFVVNLAGQGTDRLNKVLSPKPKSGQVPVQRAASRLAMKPNAVVKAFSQFRKDTRPAKLRKDLGSETMSPALRAADRMGTLAAVAGYEWTVDFVPLD